MGGVGRTSGLRGSLAGISGGPAIAANGHDRHHRAGIGAAGPLYTASPTSITRLLRVEQVEAHGAPAERRDAQQLRQASDNLRRNLAVAQVVCIAPNKRAALMTAPFADRLIEGVRAKNRRSASASIRFPTKSPALFGDAREDTSAVLKFGTASSTSPAITPAF